MFRTNDRILKRTIDYYIKNDFELSLTQCCQKATSGWKGLKSLRVRYQLQMLEPNSTVFVTEQPHRNLPLLVLSAIQRIETRKVDQSPRNYYTLLAVISPFDITLFPTRQIGL